MKHRKHTNQQKLQIVLMGLKGQPISQLCNDHGMGQSLYYKWREQFLSNASRAFEVKQDSSREASLKAENQRLKALVDELTLELQKSEWL